MNCFLAIHRKQKTFDRCRPVSKGENMKTKLLTALCVVAISLCGVNQCAANEGDPLDVIADVVIVRPLCLVATTIGSAFFVVCLPFAAISGSVKKTAQTLVVKPARATFTRPLGDMETLTD